MIPGATRRRKKRAQEQVAVHQTLCALVRCADLTVAIPADGVTFIALAEEVATEVVGELLRVTASGLVAPAWSLAGLLDIDAETQAWLFLKTGRGLIALGCGECMTVQLLADPEPLPRGLFRACDAIIGAFRVDEGLVARGSGTLGIWIDAQRLIGAEAIATAIREEA